VHIRTALAHRVMASRQWGWQRRDQSDSITMHLGRAAAVLIFNDFGNFQPAKCYLLPNGIDRLKPFLPLLEELAENGTFLFMATAVLNLLEVSPRPAHLGFVCAALKSWITAHPDDREFWIENSVGRRFCSVISAIVKLDPKLFEPGQQARRGLDGMLGKLVRLGVSEAHRLEEAFREIR
jgi:hypothetical protein